MPDYSLKVRAGNRWLEVAQFNASDKAHAYLAAAGLIPSEHRDKPFEFAPAPPFTAPASPIDSSMNARPNLS